MRWVSYKTRQSRTKKRISDSCRCICRKSRVGRRIRDDVTLYSFVGVAHRESWKTELLGLGFFQAEFPLEAWVTPVELSIDSAVGLLLTLEAA